MGTTCQEHSPANLTNRLAEFVVSTRYEELLPEVVAAGKRGFMDNLGVTLIGSQEPSVKMMLEVVQTSGDKGKSTVIGTSSRVSLINAAMINGQSAHALDFDDAQRGRHTHMSSPVTPALLAIGEARHSTGRDVLAAYVVGFEVGVRLGGASGFGEHLLEKKGIHPTGFLGHFGAVAGAGNLIGLDSEKMCRAFGIAATQAAGLRRAAGTMSKPVSAAKAASSGLLSALLAEQGFTAPEDIFDGDFSVFTLFDFQMDAGQLLNGLGKHFAITENGIKVYACAGWRNSIVDAMIQLSRKHDLKASDVAEIQILVNPQMMRFPNYPEPITGLAGKFSVEHAAAAALVDRAGTIQQFTDEKVNDPALIALRRKVKLSDTEKVKPNAVDATILTVDGRKLNHSIPVPKGEDRGNPLTQEELEDKFRGNAGAVLPANQVEKLVRMVRNIEEVTDFAQLLRLCRAKA